MIAKHFCELIARDADVVDAELLRLHALALEHARDHLLDAVGRVGEPNFDAGAGDVLSIF